VFSLKPDLFLTHLGDDNADAYDRKLKIQQLKYRTTGKIIVISGG
jgi:hypothetical protein